MPPRAPQAAFGLVGFPVKHSYSPSMHRAAFAHYRMEASYELFEVPPQDLDDFFGRAVAEKKMRGFNVTVPHKERAVAYLTGEVAESVRANRAVNTVRVEPDGRLSGLNTDGAGFLRDLEERGIDVSGRRVVLLGAGGGAKAVATALAGRKIAELSVADIDLRKAEELAAIVSKILPQGKVRVAPAADRLDVKGADILINATPVGMNDADPLLVRPESLAPRLFVYDLIYNPAETKLLKAAREAGCRAANGLGMLLYQGCLAFEWWTGKDAPVEAMRRALPGRIHG